MVIGSNIAWYLFSLSISFNLIVGITQLLGGVLLLFNRTVLLGAVILLPVLFNIFLIDLAFTTNMFGSALPVRLMGMILCNILIMVYLRKERCHLEKFNCGSDCKIQVQLVVLSNFFNFGICYGFYISDIFGAF